MNTLKYVIDKGTHKEIIRNDKSLFLCPFCGLWFNGLAYHTSQKHNVTGKQLRKLLNVCYNYQLITPSLKERHKQIVLENKESHIKRNLLIKGKPTRFKEGFEGHIKSKWSGEALHKLSVKHKLKQNKV